jgi:magnesium chelatase subunit D
VTLPEEILLEAVRASLPPDVLARLAAGRAARAKSGASGTGAARRATAAAAPCPPGPASWATAREDRPRRHPARRRPMAAPPPAASPRGHLVHIRPEDIRVKRFEETSDRLLVFTVDASGSAAMARLGEAKGAVELLLARPMPAATTWPSSPSGATAPNSCCRPPARLVQTKRRLAGLPGGGGTPLAHGLQAAMELAGQARAAA